MALVLGMNLDKDNEIWLNDLKITIDQIKSPTKTLITAHGKSLINKFEINTEVYVEVAPQVKMMLGTDTNRDNFCRVLVEAPQNIRVERGQRYHAK